MKNSTPYIDTYSTKDIYLASTIIAIDIPLLDLVKNEKQFTFIFAKTKDLDVVVFDYWGGVLSVEPKRLFNAFKELKNRMYNEVYE